MTLRELFSFIEEKALQIPDIRSTVENDITTLNSMREVQYGVFGITQNPHSSDLEYMRFSLNLFYIDRLNNSRDNEVQIQSHGIEVLRQLLRLLADDLSFGDAQYTSFHDRFQDLCAGVYVTVTFNIPVSDCIDI